MIIKAEGKFWSDEKGAGVWTEISESAINYDIWTREPSAERIVEIKSAMRAAYALDEASRDSASSQYRRRTWNCYWCRPPASATCLFYNLFEFPTPNYEACRKNLGTDLLAMEAYESFRLASLESEGQ